MGILIDTLAIGLGSLFGSSLRNKIHSGSYHSLGIGIMLVSLVGFLENMYNVQGSSITSSHLVLVLICYLLGSKTGELMRLEERLSNLSKTGNAATTAFMDTTLFFGVGGLQISGPIALAVFGDNGQLLIKSLVDIPFAIAFGVAYGKAAALACIPVAAIQILICLTAKSAASFFTTDLTMQICAMGYIILFFSGFNLMTDGKHKIHNIDMLPGIAFIIIIHLVQHLAGGKL